MSLIYSLISHKPDIVLCEHTEYNGNFMQIIRSILQKGVKDNIKCVIPYDKYKIHYITEDGITYLSFSEELKDENAFAFLIDIKRKLLKNNTVESLLSMSTFSLENFSKVLKQYMIYYNTHPLTTKTGEVINELKAATDMMIENIENILERDAKMNIIVSKSENLNNFSVNISSVAENIRKNETNSRSKIIYIIIGVLIVIVVLYFILK